MTFQNMLGTAAGLDKNGDYIDCLGELGFGFLEVGTVTPDLATAVKAAKSGEIQFKAEKAGVVQVGIGKISFDKKKLVENCGLQSEMRL